MVSCNISRAGTLNRKPPITVYIRSAAQRIFHHDLRITNKSCKPAAGYYNSYSLCVNRGGKSFVQHSLYTQLSAVSCSAFLPVKYYMKPSGTFTSTCVCGLP